MLLTNIFLSLIIQPRLQNVRRPIRRPPERCPGTRTPAENTTPADRRSAPRHARRQRRPPTRRRGETAPQVRQRHRRARRPKTPTDAPTAAGRRLARRSARRPVGVDHAIAGVGTQRQQVGGPPQHQAPAAVARTPRSPTRPSRQPYPPPGTPQARPGWTPPRAGPDRERAVDGTRRSRRHPRTAHASPRDPGRSAMRRPTAPPRCSCRGHPIGNPVRPPQSAAGQRHAGHQQPPTRMRHRTRSAAAGPRSTARATNPSTGSPARMAAVARAPASPDATFAENRCRSAISRCAARISVAIARPWSLASCQHTASRSQCAGSADDPAAARSPPATSAPNRARAATARMTRRHRPIGLVGGNVERMHRVSTHPQFTDQHIETRFQRPPLVGAALTAATPTVTRTPPRRSPTRPTTRPATAT